MTRAGLRLLLAAPGTRVGTYDVFRYWSTALGRAAGVDELLEFPFHERIARQLERAGGSAAGPAAGVESAVESAGMELVELCETWRPDTVLVIDGTTYPSSVWPRLWASSRDPAAPIALACLFTEAPYFEQAAEDLSRWFRLMLLTERASVPRLRSRRPSTRFEYLPHCYSRDVHRPGARGEPRFDVYACCTYFPERVRLLRGVDWSSYRAWFPGQWLMASDEDRRALAPWIGDGERPNALVARDYRESRIVLNIHRSGSTHVVHGDPARSLREFAVVPPAESMGPRPVEAAACGAFQVSDPRAELLEVFGDVVPLYRDAGELSALLARYTGPEEGTRCVMASRALERIRGRSYDDRAPELVRSLSAIRDEARGVS